MKHLHGYEIEGAFASNGDPEYPEITPIHPQVHQEVMRHLGDILEIHGTLMPSEKHLSLDREDENWNDLHHRQSALAAAYKVMKQHGLDKHHMAAHISRAQDAVEHAIKRLKANAYNDKHRGSPDFYPESVSLDEIKMLVEELQRD